jgi:hypothetical protein
VRLPSASLFLFSRSELFCLGHIVEHFTVATSAFGLEHSESLYVPSQPWVTQLVGLYVFSI